jgi:hypothetical protein
MCSCIEKKNLKIIRLVFVWVFLEFVKISRNLVSASAIKCSLLAIKRTSAPVLNRLLLRACAH